MEKNKACYRFVFHHVLNVPDITIPDNDLGDFFRRVRHRNPGNRLANVSGLLDPQASVELVSA